MGNIVLSRTVLIDCKIENHFNELDLTVVWLMKMKLK